MIIHKTWKFLVVLFKMAYLLNNWNIRYRAFSRFEIDVIDAISDMLIMFPYLHLNKIVLSRVKSYIFVSLIGCF